MSVRDCANNGIEASDKRAKLITATLGKDRLGRDVNMFFPD